MGRRKIAFDPTFKNRGRGKKRGTISFNEPLQPLTGSLTFYNSPTVGEGEYLIVSDSHTAKEISEGSATPIFWIANDDNVVEIVNGLPNNVTTVNSKAEALLYLASNDYAVISSETSNIVTDELILDLNAKNDLSFTDKKPTSNLIYTNSNVYQVGSIPSVGFPVLFPGGEIINGTSQGGMSWTDHLRWYNETIPSGTTISISGWYMAYNSNTSAAWNNSARLIIYSSAGYGGTVSNPGAWNTWDYFELTYNVSQDTTSWRLEDAGYDYYNSSEAPNTSAYTCNVQIETLPSPTPFVNGTREQNTVWKDMSGGPAGNETWYTLYGLQWRESDQTPANRDGITPGYNVISGTKTYDCSRDLNYFAFDEDTNTWVADSYFNGERINGHSYDTYDGQPSQHQKFQDDFDNISSSFSNVTHIVIGSHAAENNDNDSDTLSRLQRIGLPDSHIGVERPEYILVGKTEKPYTHRYVRENVSSTVAKMNLSLPLEGSNNVNLYNGTVFNPHGWLEFDGSNDKAYSSNDYTYGTETTWVATVRRASNNNNYNMFMGDFLPYFGFRASENHKVHFSNDIGGQQRNVYSSTQTSINTWYHIAFTTEYNSPNTTMKVYLNGVQEGSGTWAGSQTQRSGESKKFTIGDGRSNAGWYPFAGDVSNVQIYNKTLSSSEISQNYYGGPIVTNGLTFAVDAGNLVSYVTGSTSTTSMTGSLGGALVNGVAYNPNRGGYWTFDGSNDVITIGNNAVFNHTSQLTIEAWVNFDSNSSDFIFEKGNVNTQYSLFSHSTDIVFRTKHSGDSSYHTQSPSKTSVGIVNGQWHHIVGSWDGSTKRIYVDGVLKNSVSKSGALVTTSAGAAIGRFGGTSTGYYFDGGIAIVRIYNKGLSANEVGQNFNAQKARFGL
jgi:hypothetical protein